MKYYIIAGEASGDLHGANLIRELKCVDQNAEFRVWGGDLMQQQGAELVKHYSDHAFMGFVPVIVNLPTIKQNFTYCENDLETFRPDVVILIDYSGFNLRIAKFAKNAGFKVFYYVSPQLWAWRKRRVFKVKKYVDRLFSILPFEKDFYQNYNYSVDFVGHPLLDALEQQKHNMKSLEEFTKYNHLNDKPVIAVLPGSRRQEIKTMLPLMLSIVEYYADYQFVIAGAPSFNAEYYKHILGDKPVPIVFGQTYELLQYAVAALVTSGTATLETALFHTPQVVCYKGGFLTYQIVKYMVDIQFISIVNLIMNEQVVKELIQYDLNKNNIKTELDRILFDEQYKALMKKNYQLLKDKLGGIGASKRTAELMFSILNGNKPATD